MRTILATVGATVLLAAMASSMAAGYSWEFNTAGNFEGWSATSNVSGLAVANGCLSGDVRSIDPYLVGPRGDDIDARQYRYVVIRMRQTRGFMGQFYWGSKDEPFHSGDRQLYFGTKPDGFFHTYTLDMSKVPSWKGLVNSPRLDPHEDDITGHFDIDYIRISKTAPPQLEITGPSTAGRFACVGETFDVTATVKNTGGSDATNVRGSISHPGLKVLSAQTQSVDIVPPGQERKLTWWVRAALGSADSIRLEIASDAPGGRVTQAQLLPIVARVGQCTSSVYVEGGGGRMVFYRCSEGYVAGELYAGNSAEGKLMGTTCPLSRIVIREPDGSYTEMPLVPRTVTMDQYHRGVTFYYSCPDSRGGVWSGTISYTAASDGAATRATYTLSCSKDRELAAWTGPSFYAGNRSFGSSKDEAIFPGLEWLDGHDPMPGGDRSSNSLDMDPMFACRLVPHPYKVTVPLMAVSEGGFTAGIEWDPLQKWDGVHTCPSAAFASPNWYQGQANHMMELFVPSVPEWVGENATMAASPYKLAAGRKLRMEGCYYVARDAGEMDRIFPDYYARFFGGTDGTPDAPALPGPVTALSDIISDARTGYMGSLWDESGPGWRIRYKPDITYPDTAATRDIFCESLYTSDPALKRQLRERAEAAAKAAIAKSGPGGLVSTTASEQDEVGLPYFMGHLEESLDAMQSAALAALKTQRSDGSWTIPFDPKYPDLTTPRDMVFLGECAKNAYTLLREARRTGDDSFAAAGLKALDYMSRFRVAAGVPGSELPQHSPCLRAVQYAMCAYLDAYLLTRQQRFLDRSVKWARVGLQFIYTWGAPDRPIMPYGDACYYGASYFNGTRWMGKSVPWISQIYAYHLQRLSCFDSSMPWRKIAQGIAHHSYQSMLASPYPHAYPDCVRLVEDNGVIGLYFIPEQPYKLASALLSREYAQVDMTIATGFGRKACVSSCGSIPAAAFRTPDELTFAIAYPAGETANILVYGVAPPAKVLKGDRALPEVDDVDTVPEGWKYNTAHKCVIIKETQTSDWQRLVLSAL